MGNCDVSGFFLGCNWAPKSKQTADQRKVLNKRTVHELTQRQQRSDEGLGALLELESRLLPFRRHEGRGEGPVEYLPVRRAKCDRVELLPLLSSE